MKLIKTGFEYGVIAWVALETFLLIHYFEMKLVKSFKKRYTTVDIHKEDKDGQG